MEYESPLKRESNQNIGNWVCIYNSNIPDEKPSGFLKKIEGGKIILNPHSKLSYTLCGIPYRELYYKEDLEVPLNNSTIFPKTETDVLGFIHYCNKNSGYLEYLGKKNKAKKLLLLSPKNKN